LNIDSFRRSLRRAASVGVLVLAAGLAATAVEAQQLPAAVPNSDTAKPGRTGPEIPTTPDFDFSIVAPHRSAVPRAVDEVHFKLVDIQIAGATTIPAAAFRPLYDGMIGKDITLGDILDVADKIERAYRARGYLLVRAFVPPQRVKNGIFTIHVVEGHLSNVAVDGGDNAVKRKVRAYMRPALREQPLTMSSMERGLLLANDLPGVGATGLLKASPDTPGASDLVVDVTQNPFTGGLAVDNRGSRFSGLWTLSGDVEINSIFGADQLAATVTSSPASTEQIAGSVRYRRAIGDDGLVASLVGTITHGEPGSTLAKFDVLTDSWAVGARLTYPLIRSRAETLTLDGGFTAQDATVNVANSHDQWRVIDLGGSYQRSLSDGILWTSTFDAAQGLPILGATPDGSLDLSRKPGGSTTFTKLTGSSRLLLPLWGDFSTMFNVQGQLAFVRLITGEQIAFGGTQIGRGYDPGAITGDDGVGGSAELRYDFHFTNDYIKALQPYVYVDGARAWYLANKAPSSLVDGHLTSVGGGFRFWLPYNVTGALEGSRTLNAVQGSDGGKQATKLLLDLAIRF
jgi:hemolysin activation/secretion protein